MKDEAYLNYHNSWTQDFRVFMEEQLNKGWPEDEAEETVMFKIGPMLSYGEFHEMGHWRRYQ